MVRHKSKKGIGVNFNSFLCIALSIPLIPLHDSSWRSLLQALPLFSLFWSLIFSATTRAIDNSDAPCCHFSIRSIEYSSLPIECSGMCIPWFIHRWKVRRMTSFVMMEVCYGYDSWMWDRENGMKYSCDTCKGDSIEELFPQWKWRNYRI